MAMAFNEYIFTTVSQGNVKFSANFSSDQKILCAFL